MKIIHIVRRFKPVGGMENFVVNLVKQQLGLGNEVTVLCRESIDIEGLDPPGLIIEQLPSVALKPRWLDGILFAIQCQRWLLQKCRHSYDVVHSHERTWSQNFVTFHGQVYANSSNVKIARYFSLRHHFNLYLEKKQVLCSSDGVIPVSDVIAKQLRYHYGRYSHKLLSPVYPGTDTSGTPVTTARYRHCQRHHKCVIGFIGKEWKRKGLKFAIDVFEQYVFQYGEAELHIYGCEETDISRLLPRHLISRTTIYGWVSDIHQTFDGMNVLLHPASSEPYGMVIAEALRHNVPVVASDMCGAHIEVQRGRGYVLSLDDSAAQWASALRVAIKRGYQGTEFRRSWNEMAVRYLQLYRSVYRCCGSTHETAARRCIDQRRSGRLFHHS